MGFNKIIEEQRALNREMRESVQQCLRESDKQSEIRRLRAEMFDKRMREAGISQAGTVEELSLRQKVQLAEIASDCDAYAERLREGTRELLNVSLAEDGIPMRDGVGAPSVLLPDAPQLSQEDMTAGLLEEGIPMLRSRRGDGLTMVVREANEAGVKDCPDCETGRKANGDVCPTCKGAGVIERPGWTKGSSPAVATAREAAAISAGLAAINELAQQRESEHAEAELARENSVVPIRESADGTDLSAVVEAAQYFTPDDSPVLLADGTHDLSVHGVPMRESDSDLTTLKKLIEDERHGHTLSPLETESMKSLLKKYGSRPEIERMRKAPEDVRMRESAGPREQALIDLSAHGVPSTRPPQKPSVDELLAEGREEARMLHELGAAA